jgi:Cu/Zn superoxide dismutase
MATAMQMTIASMMGIHFHSRDVCEQSRRVMTLAMGIHFHSRDVRYHMQAICQSMSLLERY